MKRPGVVKLVVDQFVQVQVEHPNLELVLTNTREMIVRGIVRFDIERDNRSYRDSYQVEITIPEEYPTVIPESYETGGSIPIHFHRFRKSGKLCLGAPIELARVFSQDRTLIHYINKLLIPYLFSFTYFREHNDMPHGELSHGSLGLAEYYGEFFSAGLIAVMKLLKLLSDNFAPPLMPCPCGSGRNLKDCHGPRLDELKLLMPSERFGYELRGLIDDARKAGISLPERDVLPKQTLRNRKQRLRRREKRKL